MLFAVPFFLLIILKIVGASQLLLFVWGDSWACILWSMLGAYVLSMIGGQILANGFGYYSHAIRWVFWLPASHRAWIVGRNLAHGLFATVQFAGLGMVLFLFLPDTSSDLLALPVGSFFFGLFCMLCTGNMLSAIHPRRFHFRLARRDRPEPSSFLWMMATLAFCTIVTMAVVGVFGSNSVLTNITLLVLPLLGCFFYRRLLPVMSIMVGKNKEIIIGAITK